MRIYSSILLLAKSQTHSLLIIPLSHHQTSSSRSSLVETHLPCFQTSATTTITNTIYRGVPNKTERAVVKITVDISSELGPKEVLIKITHSYLCYTDIHMMSYGVALGHEGVGIVEKVGSEVTTLKIGDRAGGGYLRNVSRPEMEHACITDHSLIELRTLQLLHQRQGYLLLRAQHFLRERLQCWYFR